MTVQHKQEPEPLDRSEVLRAALDRAAQGEVADDLAISLRVTGGAPGQHYRFAFASRGGRVEACSLDCDLSDRHATARDRDGDADMKALTSLGRRLSRSKVLAVEPQPARFLPDTVVGILEITVGGMTYRTYFAADPDQAAVQDRTPPAEVLAAADAVYATAADVLGIANVRP